jgi:hypothetical protein
MLVGHFAVAFVGKRIEPSLSLMNRDRPARKPDY